MPRINPFVLFISSMTFPSAEILYICPASAISYQLSAISYQLSAMSYELSAISYELSAFSYQF